MKNRSLDRHSLCRSNKKRFSRDWLRLLRAIVILFGIVFLVFMLFVWSVDAFSFDYTGIRKPDKEMCKETRTVLDGLQKPDIEAAASATSTFRDPKKIEITKDTAGNTAIHESSIIPPYAAHENTLSSQEKMYYFFSFSVPQGVLEDAVNDALRLRKEGVNVVLVLRGLVGNDFKSTIRKFYDFMKESGLDNSDLPVELHPQLFSTYAVTRVPHVVYESDERTGSISGVSISHALSKFRKEVKDYGKYGTTYKIEEENLLEVIEAHLKSPEVQERIRSMPGKAKDKMYKLTKLDGTDFYSGIKYRDAIGSIIRVTDYDPPEVGFCGRGLHACRKPNDCFVETSIRSEERRVGKECRSRWSP